LYQGRLPTTEHIFGRDYQRGGGPVSLKQAEKAEPGSLVVVDHGSVTVGSRGRFVPTVIYVEHSGQYWDYALEGGP
jgi:hypothetical protein